MKWFLFLMSFNFSAGVAGQPVGTKIFSCPALGVEFRLPASFKAISNDSMNKLEQRGNKAIKEEFGDKQMMGWQPACFQVNDSLKRMIMISSITRKEALLHHSSIKDFASAVFSDNNRFIFERFKTRAGISFDEENAVTQKEILLAGNSAYKNKLQCTFTNRLLFTSVTYLVDAGDKCFLVSFQASPKATDNEAIELALEQAGIIKE